jgi:hypothetical protein
VNLLQKVQRKREKIHRVLFLVPMKIKKGGEILFCERIDNKTSAENNIVYHLATLVNRVQRRDF